MSAHTKVLLSFLGGLLLVGAGCLPEPTPIDLDVSEVQARVDVTIPADAIFYDDVVDIIGYYNVIGYTDLSPAELAKQWHDELVAAGYDDTIPIAQVNPEGDDPLIGSYLSQNANGSVRSTAITIGYDRGQTQFGILTQ